MGKGDYVFGSSITAQGSLKIDLSPVPGAPEDGLQISFLLIFETTLCRNTGHRTVLDDSPTPPHLPPNY